MVVKRAAAWRAARLPAANVSTCICSAPLWRRFPSAPARHRPTLGMPLQHTQSPCFPRPLIYSSSPTRHVSVYGNCDPPSAWHHPAVFNPACCPEPAQPGSPCFPSRPWRCHSPLSPQPNCGAFPLFCRPPWLVPSKLAAEWDACEHADVPTACCSCSGPLPSSELPIQAQLAALRAEMLESRMSISPRRAGALPAAAAAPPPPPLPLPRICLPAEPQKRSPISLWTASGCVPAVHPAALVALYAERGAPGCGAFDVHRRSRCSLVC